MRGRLRCGYPPAHRVSNGKTTTPMNASPILPTSSAPRGTGLSHDEASARLAAEGFNELPRSQRRSALRVVLEVLREPMLALLLGGGVVYLLLGSRAEALTLLAFACLSIGITVVQELRTERVLDALRDLTSPRALVVRDGEHRRIAGREVVRGDVILLAEGDRVPADATLISADALLADESLLTGEAVPVEKDPASRLATGGRPGGDGLAQVFSGSLIVRGTAVAEVTAVGARSEIGRIGASLELLETETPHLQRQMRTLVVLFALVGAAVSVLVVVLYGLTRGGWLEGILAGIAVGMSMLPEEFPMVLAVFMAMGAWRISKVRVLTRRASAIESLGAATVLCTDKTGTLTENRMVIARLQTADGQTVAVEATPLPASFHRLVSLGRLASTPEPFDPMEKAFFALAKSKTTDSALDPATLGSLMRSYGLTPGLLAMSQVWPDGAGGWLIAAKGAPEAIADLCRLDGAARQTLKTGVDTMATAGLRVLAVAEATWADVTLPEAQTAFAFRWVGLVGLEDPLRASVPDAVAECLAAGIRVIMITGDHPATAITIAHRAGLKGDRVVSGQQLETLSDTELGEIVRDVTVFARVMPEQKLRIVTALKAAGEVVAMTGDGVNDAPSLKAAHIGVAMGGRGTDVAREAASIVLLDDDFGSIVTTIRLGRRIYDNLRKAMSFILAVHVPIAGLALMPLLFGMPILFGPMHIAFLEMIIDPVCSLVFEAETEERDTMKRRPRPVSEPLFSGPTVLASLVQGGVVLGVVAAIFAAAPGQGLSDEATRAVTFTSLVFSIIALILFNRSSAVSMVAAILRPNPALAIALPLIGVVLGVTLLWDPARAMFGFALPDNNLILVAPAAGGLVLLVLEGLKLIRHTLTRARPSQLKTSS
jgi:P-type Ca2+ transporter type 2C